MSERIDTPLTNEHFAAFCLSMLGQPYWYGTALHKCSESLRASKARQYPSHYGSSRTSRYRDDIAKKKVCADCMGGAKGYAWTSGGQDVLEAIGTDKTFEKKSGSNGCPDKSSNSMFSWAKSQGMDWGTIDTLPDIVGLAVRFDGHVGYTVGGFAGAVTATVGIVLPGVILVLIIVSVLDKFRGNRYVDAAFYGLRPASTALIAAAAFGTSVGVTRVVVNGREGSIAGANVLSLEFGRIPFTMGAMAKIRSGEFSAPATECDPATLFDMLHLTHIAANIDGEGNLRPVEPLAVELSVPYTPVAEDTRPLPEDLRGMLHADIVSDLDVMSEQNAELGARYRAIMEEKDDSLLLAVAQL